MIDFEEVKTLIEQNSSKLRCHKIGLKPLELALAISILSNSVDDYGYIIIGAERINGIIDICGLASSVNITTPIQKACELFGGQKPRLEFSNFSIKSHNVFVLKVNKYIEQLHVNLPKAPQDKEGKFILDLFYACVKLQANYLYKEQIEDNRNAFIEALLEAKGYRTKDQTRRGLSAVGKGAGEVDIFIQNEFNMPFTVVEALNLDCLNKDYLNKHIDKIYNYDTTGNKFNVCLSYVKVANFEEFWNRYLDYIKMYNYKYELISIDERYEDTYCYSEIRIVKTSHARNGKQTSLYHLAVNLS